MAAFDLVVAGAGIVGLAHALAAARRGLRVALVERDADAQRSSVQNFGFVVLAGQAQGPTRERVRRSLATWREVTRAAGIAVHQQGSLTLAGCDEALELLGEYAAAPMGEGCELLSPAKVRERLPEAAAGVRGALWSPHDLRVEARAALPAITSWLAERHGVALFAGRCATGIEANGLATDQGLLEAGAVVVAPGAGLDAILPEAARRVQLRHCMLQMLRLAPAGVRLPGVLMGDLSLLRYEGFASCPGAAALRTRLERERAECLAAGVHVIVAQGADGSLVVGDSHRYADAPDGKAGPRDEALILEALGSMLDLPECRVVERWVGSYPVAQVKPVIVEAPLPRARVVVVTNGLGMSTAFALGEETVDALFG